jgi:hypothetical protein
MYSEFDGSVVHSSDANHERNQRSSAKISGEKRSNTASTEHATYNSHALNFLQTHLSATLAFS